MEEISQIGMSFTVTGLAGLDPIRRNTLISFLDDTRGVVTKGLLLEPGGWSTVL
jgi:hypothetical protein